MYMNAHFRSLLPATSERKHTPLAWLGSRHYVAELPIFWLAYVHFRGSAMATSGQESESLPPAPAHTWTEDDVTSYFEQMGLPPVVTGTFKRK